MWWLLVLFGLCFVVGLVVTLGSRPGQRTGPVLLVIGILIFVAWGVSMAVRANNQQNACEAAGGVLVRGGVCVDNDAVIEVDR
jgi:hypothetical protein